MYHVCLFCGGNASEPDHLKTCDGRQGRVEADFDGDTYDRARDRDRLRAQLTRVHTVLRDRQWHTLAEIATKTGDPESSISARLRDLRKTKFGGYTIARQYVERGLWAYRLEQEPQHAAIEQ
jgi:hypothetical protein